MNVRQTVRGESWALKDRRVVDINQIHIHAPVNSPNVYIDAVPTRGGVQFNVLCIDKVSFNELLSGIQERAEKAPAERK